MDLRASIRRQIKASGLKPYQWAVAKELSKSTFRDVMRTGRASGRTLAKLVRAGVELDKKAISALDAA